MQAEASEAKDGVEEVWDHRDAEDSEVGGVFG
jgi:hypothetical protein